MPTKALNLAAIDPAKENSAATFVSSVRMFEQVSHDSRPPFL